MEAQLPRGCCPRGGGGMSEASGELGLARRVPGGGAPEVGTEEV